MIGLRNCQWELLHHLKCLTNPAHREVEVVEEPSVDGEANEEMVDEATISRVLDMFATMDGRGSTVALLTSERAEALKTLACALTVNSLSTMDITKELIRRVLFTSNDASRGYLISNARVIRIHRIDYESSKAFLDAHSVEPLIGLFQARLDKYVEPSQLDWWVIIWLIGMYQYQRENGLKEHVDEGVAVSLFVSAMQRLADSKEASKGDQTDEWIACLGSLFLQLWVAADFGAHSSSWMADNSVKAFAAYLKVLDGEKTVTVLEAGSSRGQLPIASRRYEVPINYEHTFHYMEHAFNLTTAAAFKYHLKEVSSNLLEEYCGDYLWGYYDDNLDPSAKAAARRAREAYSQTASQNPLNSASWTCGTCNVKSGKDS